MLNTLKNTKRYLPGEISIDGIKLVYPDSLSLYYMWKDVFENELYRFTVKDNVQSQANILDIGANIGISAIYFSKKYPHHVIHAYEADPEIFDYLERNIAHNHCTNVELHNYAVWNSSTEITFYPEGADAGTTILNPTAGSGITVRAIDFREILSGLEGSIDMIKIDIEGAERNIFEDYPVRLSSVQNMFVEYHSFVETSQNLNDLLSVISDAGFRYKIFNLSDRIEKAPLTKHSNYLGMDLQLNIFCFRV